MARVMVWFGLKVLAAVPVTSSFADMKSMEFADHLPVLDSVTSLK